jgi:hypothetical protein
LGPNSGVAPFAASVGRAVVSHSRASPSCCAFNDKDDKEENSSVQDKNRTTLSFMRTPAHDGYGLLQTIALIRNNSRTKIRQRYEQGRIALSTPATTTAAEGMDWNG